MPDAYQLKLYMFTSYCCLHFPGKDKGDSLKNAAADFEGTEVHVYHIYALIDSLNISEVL